MSYEGRTWPKLGKSCSASGLWRSRGYRRTTVFWALLQSNSPGLTSDVSYLGLVQQAFQPAYWSSNSLVDSSGAMLTDRTGPPSSTDEFTQAEFNFALFWGIAIQAYEATLISDDTRYDRFAEGDRTALSADEQNGLNLFRSSNRGDCSNCHAGAEFSAASSPIPCV